MSLVALALTALSLQSVQTASDLALRLAGMTAVSGLEQALADSLIELIPGSQRDRAGSVVVTVGSGAPNRLVICPVDESGYVVGNVTDDGFPTLRRVGRPPSPLFDQWHEGHRVTIWTRNGPRAGVVAVPSTHLTRGRAVDFNQAFTVDDAYIEVGAESADDVAELGIALLDPVALLKIPHRYGPALLAAPWAAPRGACAALASVLLDGPRVRGTVVAAFAVESRLRHRGLLTVGNTRGPFDETLFLEYAPPRRLPQGSFGRVRRVAIDARYRDTPVETIDLSDVENLANEVRGWMGGER
jgi:putative aminopeptidase FrvX